MRKQRNASGWCVLLALAVVAGVALQSSAAAEKQRAKRKKDGKDDVVGAIWELEATNPKTGKVEKFRFRAKDGVLYDRYGKKIGTLTPLKPGLTKVRLFDDAPLPGTFTVTMNKIGHWAGIFESKEGQWKVKFAVRDR